jgi:dsRNA-specific ribonuclease
MVVSKKLFQDEYYIEKILKLLEKLNITSQNIDNYLLAFVHRSLVNERPDFSSGHNERLEFL